jgi:hypothetical protein
MAVNSNLSPAGQQLNLMGDLPSAQSGGETEEEKKRRLAMRQQGLAQSPAMTVLLGGTGGYR